MKENLPLILYLIAIIIVGIIAFIIVKEVNKAFRETRQLRNQLRNENIDLIKSQELVLNITTETIKQLVNLKLEITRIRMEIMELDFEVPKHDTKDINLLNPKIGGY